MQSNLYDIPISVITLSQSANSYFRQPNSYFRQPRINFMSYDDENKKEEKPFNRNKFYYKILNQTMKHYDFQYQLGLNIDTIPFNPSGSCKPGGLYFTDLENVFDYMNYGTLIAKIRIPKKAKVHTDTDNMYTKYKADMIYIVSITPLEDFQSLFDSKTVDQILVRSFNLLQYVKDQTDEICKSLLKQDPYAIQYIRNQTFELCKLAIDGNPDVLQFVQNPSFELCLYALEKNINVVQFIPDLIIREVFQKYNKLCNKIKSIEQIINSSDSIIDQNTDVKNINH